MRRLPLWLFLALQGVLLLGLVVWALLARAEQAAERALPEGREQPLSVRPLHDDPEVVSDQALMRVLLRLALKDEGMNTSMGHVDHVLRLWGPLARFPDESMMSGEKMLALALDHQRFAGAFGQARPLLMDVPGGGVRVRALEGPQSVSHVDHLLATLGELGIPLSQPIRTPRGGATLRAVLEQSLADFHPNQVEYEWSVLAYTLYLPPVTSWFTTEGQRIDFGRLADRVMREDLSRGVCSAQHRMFALVAMLRVDEQMRSSGSLPLLANEKRAEVTEYLRGVTARFVEHQHEDGFWNFDWPERAPTSSEASARDGDRLGDRIIATGHALEWWSLAPEEVLPPRDTVRRAAQWIVGTVDGLSDEAVQENISFLSHAGRALAQWRGRTPIEVMRDRGSATEASPR